MGTAVERTVQLDRCLGRDVPVGRWVVGAGGGAGEGAGAEDDPSVVRHAHLAEEGGRGCDRYCR